MNGQEKVSRCSRYRLDVVRNLSDQGLLPGRDINVTELEQEECLNGWSYSKDIYQSTIVSEVRYICCIFTFSLVFLLGFIIGFTCMIVTKSLPGHQILLILVFPGATINGFALFDDSILPLWY